MSEAHQKSKSFREVGSNSMVDVNPAAVRFLRKADLGTEIVFSETHTLHVHSIMAAVRKVLFDNSMESAAHDAWAE